MLRVNHASCSAFTRAPIRYGDPAHQIDTGAIRSTASWYRPPLIAGARTHARTQGVYCSTIGVDFGLNLVNVGRFSAVIVASARHSTNPFSIELVGWLGGVVLFASLCMMRIRRPGVMETAAVGPRPHGTRRWPGGWLLCWLLGCLVRPAAIASGAEYLTIATSDFCCVSA